MIVGEAVRQAVATLRLQRTRTLLTMFGVVWGTASVIFLLAWGQGLERMLEAGFTRIGRDLAVTWAGRIGEQYTPASDRRYLWYTREDAEVLSRRARHVELVGAESMIWGIVSYGQRSFTRDVRGVEAANFELRGIAIAAGRPILRSDVDGRRRVAVLGATVRRKLLGSRGGVGSRIQIDGHAFEVVGLMQRVGTQLWRDRSEIDEQVWIPITSLLAMGPRYGLDTDVVDNLLFRFPGPDAFERTKAEVRGILARRLRVSPADEEAIYVISASQALEQIPLDELQGVFFVLAFTTLAIGGVGIMNMMLDSVHERRNEIGVRLAVGATRRDVIGQFFLETLAITGLGGLAGIALGIGACVLLGRFETADLIPVPVLRGDIVAVALGVMTGVGLLASLLPAWRAARVDPSLILRAE